MMQISVGYYNISRNEFARFQFNTYCPVFAGTYALCFAVVVVMNTRISLPFSKMPWGNCRVAFAIPEPSVKGWMFWDMVRTFAFFKLICKVLGIGTTKV